MKLDINTFEEALNFLDGGLQEADNDGATIHNVGFRRNWENGLMVNFHGTCESEYGNSEHFPILIKDKDGLVYGVGTFEKIQEYTSEMQSWAEDNDLLLTDVILEERKIMFVVESETEIVTWEYQL